MIDIQGVLHKLEMLTKSTFAVSLAKSTGNMTIFATHKHNVLYKQFLIASIYRDIRYIYVFTLKNRIGWNDIDEQ